MQPLAYAMKLLSRRVENNLEKEQNLNINKIYLDKLLYFCAIDGIEIKTNKRLYPTSMIRNKEEELTTLIT